MERINKRKDMDMTEGPILKKILIFVLPLIITNLLQTLYNAADMMVVSLSDEANAVGAIGTTGSLASMIVNIFIGFSIGTNVVLARYLGAKDNNAAERTVHTSIVMSMIFGVLGALIGILIARPVLALLGNQGNLLDLSALYMQIYCCGIPFISVTNYCVSILRAKGDTKTPLLVLSGAGVLNVALNLFFVLVARLSVEGVALATAISNAASAVVLIIILIREKGPCRLNLKRLKIDRRVFCSILQVGLPAGIQGALFALSNMIIQSSIISVNNSLGLPADGYQPVVDGNAAATNLEGFLYTVINAVTQATITFVSQNLGAGKFKRVRQVMGRCYLVSITVAVLSSILLLTFIKPLLALYGIVQGDAGSLEQIAFDTAYLRMLYVTMPYALISLMEVGSGALRGLGRSTTSTLICLTGACAFRILWTATVFRAFGTIESIYLSYPISWTLTGAILLVFCLVISHKLIKSDTDTQALITR